MSNSALVLDSVRRSHAPSSEKSAIQRFYDNLTAKGSGMATTVGHKLGMARHSISAGTQAIRKGGEAFLVGGALGAADAYLSKGDPTKSGLDIPVAVGGGYNVPADAALGAVAMLASLAPQLAKGEEDLQTVGVIGIASWSQRQVKGWVQAKQSGAPAPAAGGGAGVHGDPVLDWAASQS